MMKSWDYRCPHHGVTTRYFEGKIPQRVTCYCRRRISWARQKTKADLTMSFSGNYGKFEPALGCVVESYEHKQQLLNEQNVMEAHDLVGGSRMYRQEEPSPIEDNNTSWVDNPNAKE